MHVYSGESYASDAYIPYLVDLISKHNGKGGQEVNLIGMAMGNGGCDCRSAQSNFAAAVVDFAHGHSLISDILYSQLVSQVNRA